MPGPNITSRIARHAFGQLGLFCIQAALHPVGSELSVSTSDQFQPSADAAVHWFRTRKAAENLLTEVALLEAVPWHATCHDSGVLIDVPPHEMDAVMAECCRWVGVWQRPIPPEEIAERMAGIEREIGRCIVQLQRTGAMKTLNRQYKALRTRPRTAGEKVPSCTVWLGTELERLVLRAMHSRVA